MQWVTSVLLLSKFFVFQQSEYVFWCGSEFIHLSVCGASQMCRFTSFIIFGKFSTIIFFQTLLPIPFSLSSASGSLMYILILDGVLQSLRLCSFFFILFSFCSSYWITSIGSSSWLFLQPSQICYNPLVNFSFQLSYFLTPECLVPLFIISIPFLIFCLTSFSSLPMVSYIDHKHIQDW